MGLDVDNIILCQPDNGEMALEVVDQLVRSSAVDIIAIDSVAALTPRAEIEGEIGAVQGLRQAVMPLVHALEDAHRSVTSCSYDWCCLSSPGPCRSLFPAAALCLVHQNRAASGNRSPES